MTTSLLCPDAFLSPLEIDAAVTRALAEDLGRAGDVTSIATIPEDTRARAIVVARKTGVIAGLPLDQLREVLAVGIAHAVLLDNMDAATMRKAVEMVAGKFALEASGNITLDNIAEIATTGVDYASSGWITHSAPNLDVGLDIEI